MIVRWFPPSLLSAGILLGVVSHLSFGGTESIEESRRSNKWGTSSIDPDHAPRFFVEQQELDLGEVEGGRPARFTLVVGNRGDEPLKLDVKPHCGCTVVHFEPSIPPHSQQQIRGELRLGGSGEFTKTVELLSNDPACPRVEVSVTCSVPSVVEVLPDRSVKLVLHSRQSTPYEFSLQTHTKEVEITEVTAMQPYIHTELELADSVSAHGESSGHKYKLKVKVEADAPAGRSTGMIQLKTSAKSEPHVILTLQCQKGIVMAPAKFASALFGMRLTKETKSQTVILRGADHTFRVLKANANDPCIKAEVRTIREGSVYGIVVRQESNPPEGMWLAEVTVETDDTEQPTVVIPVRFAHALWSLPQNSPDSRLTAQFGDEKKPQ